MKGIKNIKQGFTLLELLVVVLIIGILSSVALPQYRKAVVKSKFAEVDLVVSAAKQNIRIYLDANGWPEEVYGIVSFSGSDSEGSIDLPGDCDSDYECETELASYTAICISDFCAIAATLKFLDNDALTLRMDPDYEVWFLYSANTKEVCQWAKERNYPAAGKALINCTNLGVTLEEY